MLAAFDQYKKNQPQFKILKSTLAFSNDQTLFSPLEDTQKEANGFWGSDPNLLQNNIIFSNSLVKGKSMNTKGLHDTLNGVMKRWGNYAQTVIKALTL